LIIQTTIFDKRAYDAGLREAMRMVIDEFTLTYPGIKNVEHEYFYAVHGADEATRQGYLARAHPGARVLERRDLARPFNHGRRDRFIRQSVA
jgi:putative NADPH-quinone reductase